MPKTKYQREVVIKSKRRIAAIMTVDSTSVDRWQWHDSDYRDNSTYGVDEYNYYHSHDDDDWW
jgi:hypothetical protein